MQFAYRRNEISKLAQTRETVGEHDGVITGIASLRKAGPTDLAFLGNKKYTPDVKHSAAGIVLVPMDYEGEPREGQCYLRVDNPSLSLARICGDLEARLWPWPEPGVHPSAVVSESAQIGPGAHIGPGCIIEDDVVIGAGTWLQANVYVGQGAQLGQKCWLHPRVVVYARGVIGDRVRLNAGAVIGADGFGYESAGGEHERVPQIGNVVIGNDVEIGANSTIDRARFSSTVIGEGTKIDNLVQVGHNVEIGAHCLVVAQTGISGSTKLEDHVVLAGQAGISGHLRLAAGTVVGAQGGIHFDTEPGKYYRGSPALEASLANRIHILSKRLPELFKRLEKVEDALSVSAG